MKATASLLFEPRLHFTRKFRKLPLTTKDMNKGFYKGTRTGTMGRHTKFGGYIIEWDRVRTYVVPEGLDTFKVRVAIWWKAARDACPGKATVDERRRARNKFDANTQCLQLTPFVTNKITRPKGRYEGSSGPNDPKSYLEKWKDENGLD